MSIKILKKNEKTVSVLKDELNTVRAGRANAAILDRITVDYYGVPTPINQLGTISVPEPRVIVIQPWDAQILKELKRKFKNPISV